MYAVLFHYPVEKRFKELALRNWNLLKADLLSGVHYESGKLKITFWERQPFFLDLIRCKGLLTWNRHSVLALQKFYMAVSILSSEEKALLDLFCH